MAVAAKGGKNKESAEVSIEELSQLAITAGASIVGRIIQQLPTPSKTHYIGKGKLEELLALKDSVDYDVVIFDDALSPMQQRNLESTLKVKVIDRVALILDIFAKRARTHEGQLQVELAQHQYLLPRLAGQWSHLERLGGGIGTRGPGESQLEVDRRLIRKKIRYLEGRLEDVRKHRTLYRQKRQRSGIPVVALIGYTNSGKSTLLNALCQTKVFTENKPFTTLDPTTRRLTLPDRRVVLLTDTVGFIKKLPPNIISAFRATLEELTEASLLLHVVDLASRDAPEQCQAVEDILTNLNLIDKPRVTVLNKIDLLASNDNDREAVIDIHNLAEKCCIAEETSALISASRKWGLAKLLELISSTLNGTV